MPVVAESPTTIESPVGGVWSITVSVTDQDGVVVDDAPTVTVIPPSGSNQTPTAEQLDSGCWRVLVDLDVAGRWVCSVAAAVGAVDLVAYALAAVAESGMPDIDDLGAYLGDHSYTDDELQDALDAELAAQRRSCKVPAALGADLRRALLRRAQRALAVKKLKLGLDEPTADTDATRLGWDAEIRRYEAGYRRLPVG